jgi:hypothetical protein
MIRLLTTMMFMLASTLSLGHSMSPGFEVEQSLSVVHAKTYILTNEYDQPAVFSITVLNKDGSPALEWKADKYIYKLLPQSSREVNLRFKVTGQRKLLVCSTLTEMGKHNVKASIISRVCSRLIINGDGS